MKKSNGNCQNIRTRHWDSCFIDDNAGKGSIIFHKMTWLSARQDFHLEWESVENRLLLVYTIQGTGSIQYNEQNYSLAPHQVILFNTSQGYTVQALSDNWKLVWMQFSGFLAEKLVFEIHKYRGLVLPATSSTEKILDDVYHLTQTPSKDHRSDIRLSSKLYTLLADLMTESPVSIKTTPAISYIQGHYKENISLDMLAKLCHMSKYYFVRIFHEENGISPIDFLQHYRISIARQLLLETQYPVSIIAEKCGFETPSYFSKIFKKYCDVSPSQYRSANFQN